MTFVSYAQNFEDVMLWRALKHVERGFYIDAGAWSPDIDSVTRAFYEKCWRGINIEPNPEFMEQLRDRRPHDVNLMVALGDVEGVVMMNFLSNPGLSTLDDGIAKQHVQSGIEVLRGDVQVKTLASVWRENVPVGQAVHFLKVDVEGLEYAVLRGNEWRTNRPWVIVVEATLPMTQKESYQSWEPLLLNAGYLFAYADGLNRFYVAQEHEVLLPSFKYPPNVFDGFKLAAQMNAEARAAQIEAESRAQVSEAHAQRQVAEARAAQIEAEDRVQIAEGSLRLLVAESRVQEAEARAAEAVAKQHALQAQVDQLNGHAHHWWQQASQFESGHNALRKSWSWRITAPLRFSAGLFIHSGVTLRKSVDHALHCTVEICQRTLSRLMSEVLRRPKLARRINQTLMRYPALYQQLIAVARRQGVVSGAQIYAVSVAVGQAPAEPVLAHLPPRARQIYADLKTAIEMNVGNR